MADGQTFANRRGNDSRRDGLTEEAIKTLLGKTDLSEEAKAQSFMPVRFVGLGYRSSENMASAAYIGCFAIASFGTSIEGILVGDIKPEPS